MITRCREGEISPGRLPVLGNVYDIPQRLKELSPTYFVMFNTMTQKYEIHDSSQPDTSLCCELPFDELDARAITFARENHVSRLEIVAAEIDAYNEKLVEDSYNQKLDKANYKMREAYNYLKNNSKTDEIPKELIAE